MTEWVVIPAGVCVSCDGKGKAVLSSCPGLYSLQHLDPTSWAMARKVMSQGEASPVSGAAEEPEDVFGAESALISVFPPSSSR